MDRAWPLVEAIGDRLELLLAVEGQVRALRQVLSEEPMGVLAGAALPGALGVAAGDLDSGLSGQFGMARQLLPLVIG